jgi:cardiolipin synthase
MEIFDNKIKDAKKYVFIETFIMSPGYMLDTLVDLLEQKVKEGIEVRILYDDIGSMKHLPRKYHKTLIKKGIKCTVFNKYNPVITVVHNNRDHRKLLIVDGEYGFIGGINIADQYINEIELFGYWKDTGIKVQGEAVNEMTKLFLTDFYINIGKKTLIFQNITYIIFNQIKQVDMSFLLVMGLSQFINIK